MEQLLTPDGRYLVVKGRLWRASNPNLTPEQRQALIDKLMAARRAVKSCKSNGDAGRLAHARAEVQAAKVGLGERGAIWWSDGSRDFNRYLIKNSPYADWYRGLEVSQA